ncbi:MAG: hypothetical protein HOD92_04430 [Deltaproteobacteria bacterium]|nr:hypothetical protein [Deltaproteobacteria bacterium]MBT4526945.1 hypothetical protein [Deltaproteobacteria bacterium]
MKKYLMTLVILIFCFNINLLADTRYIKSFRIKPTKTAGGNEKMELLKRGFQVEVLDTVKNWKKIEFNGKTGWVHKLALSKKVPRQRISLLTKKVNISLKARKRASSFTSAAAARGLMDSEKSNLAILGAPNFMALFEMMALAVQIEAATLYVSLDE